MITVGKPFALGRIRATWIFTKGVRVLRLSGGVKQRAGHKGIEMSPYEAKALADWLCTSWPEPQANRGVAK